MGLLFHHWKTGYTKSNKYFEVVPWTLKTHSWNEKEWPESGLWGKNNYLPVRKSAAIKHILHNHLSYIPNLNKRNQLVSHTYSEPNYDPDCEVSWQWFSGRQENVLYEGNSVGRILSTLQWACVLSSQEVEFPEIWIPLCSNTLCEMAFLLSHPQML